MRVAYNTKLNESKVRMIRIFWRDHPEVSILTLAKRFEVNIETIRLVVHGKTWKGLPVHKPHPHRSFNVREYGDTNEKRIASCDRDKAPLKLSPSKIKAITKCTPAKTFDQDKYPRGSVLAGGNKK